METATLTSPPRPVMVQPVQKSLSLPSYARAGGEGIDHKLIFAALEQREKVRRKSKIFKEKEKCGATRQNIFCLPLSSSNKCRETSLSSDTSCSSLEFQKPKRSSSPAKISKDKSKEQNGIDGSEITPLNKNFSEKTDVNGNLDERNCFAPSASPVEKELSTKEQTNRNEISRSAVGSSDSMERTERSSKSSNDSLSRKERLVAIKARVEAERERTLCDSSSDEEETILRITRHNSDGVIHRTVREVKSKATRAERRFRRKATEESSARRVARKQHRSLYIPQSTDLDAWKPPIVRSGSSFSLQRDLDEINKDFFNFENKPKYLLSQSVPKDNYFSDICSGSYRSRFVKPVVDEIEAKERRQLLNNDRIVASFRSNKTVASADGTKSIDVSPHSSFMRDIVKKRNSRLDNSFEVSRKCNSPISRAPTPPPRSPKSMEFVNKVLLQHQTASPSNFYNEACSLERKRTVFRPKISVPTTAAELNSLNAIDRDLISARRKTCSNFSQMEDISNERPKTPSFQHQTKLSQHIPPRSPDLSQKLTGVTRRAKLSDIPTTKSSISTGKRWEKIEVDSEKKFNSLESRTKSNDTNWTKWKALPRKKRNNCICICSPNSVQDCNCHLLSQQGYKMDSVKVSFPADAESSPKLNYASNKFSHSPLDRLHKLENGVTRSYSRKLSTPEAFITSTTRTESHETKEDSEFCFTTRNDAAETLNTAMQELESVYQSLRFSNENLSEKSNKGTERSDDEFSICKHICNGSVDDYVKSKEIIKNNYPEENTHFRPVSPNRKGGLSVNEALCIEELFGDLTQQLDLEQKLLQETKSKKTPGSPVQKRNSDQVTRSDSSRVSPQTVCNNSTNNKREFTKKQKGETDSLETAAISNIKQRVMAKRKLKAVRSLSENLASIIQNETSRKEKVENNLSPDINRNSPSLEIINKMADDVSLGANKTSAGKKDSPHYKSQNLAAEVTKHSDCDEIWQVRVSMDSGNPPEDPPLQPQNPSQLRLHSALRTPSENIVRRDELQANECLKTNSSASRDKADVLLSENELEKLLAMLLRDVSNNPIPEKKHPSLPSKETHDNESAPVVSKGEMLVMQHLDVIRNYDHF